MKSRIQNLKSKIGALARFACRIPLLRLHPKFAWLEYVCPILQKRSALVTPPPGPPKLRIHKRRRVQVRSGVNSKTH
jgi:hypothetical protein